MKNVDNNLDFKLSHTDILIINSIKENSPIGLRVSTIIRLTGLKQRVIYKRLNILKNLGIISKDNPLWNIRESVPKLNSEKNKEVYISLKTKKITCLSKECYFCGYNKVLDLHHMKHRKDGGKNKKSNLIYLCPNCHLLLHRLNLNLIKLKGELIMMDSERNVILRKKQ